MLALEIEDVKQFMMQLFSKDTFDAFWLYEAKIKMAASYVVDGSLNMDFYDQEEKEMLAGRSYALWKEQKNIIFSMIRGHKTPENMQIVLMHSPSNTEKMILANNLPISPSEVRGLFLNIYYKQGKLSCTTGVSLKSFTLEKGLERLWEDMIQKYFHQKQIISTQVS
jgi:hypothetical protein